MAIADRNGVPIAAYLAAASRHEAPLVEATLNSRLVDQLPERLIGDKAYDSDPLDARLAAIHVEMIAKNFERYGKRKAPSQDGRALRRAKRRWRIERVFAWLQNFRRLVTRYERKAENFLAFVHLGFIVIALRHF
jgi:transposase